MNETRRLDGIDTYDESLIETDIKSLVWNLGQELQLLSVQR